MFTNLPIDHINTSIAESSGRATRKGSPTRVLENRANQLPEFSADELAIHCSLYFTLQAHAKPTIENRRLHSQLITRPLQDGQHSPEQEPRPGIVYTLWDYAMWRGDGPTERNPIELVTVKGATKRTRQPRSLTVAEFQKLIAELHEPFRTVALTCVCFGLRISEALALKWSAWIG